MNVERKKWCHKLLRPLLNAMGALKGTSGCLICGDNWNWKRGHYVEYINHQAAFPTCEECWETKDTIDIVDAANRLAALWIEQSSDTAAVRAHANAMVEAVKTAAYARVFIGKKGYAERV
jgi:hypothetical protein